MCLSITVELVKLYSVELLLVNYHVSLKLKPKEPPVQMKTTGKHTFYSTYNNNYCGSLKQSASQN